MKLACLWSLLLACAVGCIAPDVRFGTVLADTYALADENGEVRAILLAKGNAVGLSFLGDPSALFMLGQAEGRSFQIMRNKSGDGSGSILMLTEDGPELVMFDAKGRIRLMAFVSAGLDQPDIVLFDENQEVTHSLGVSRLSAIESRISGITGEISKFDDIRRISTLEALQALDLNQNE